MADLLNNDSKILSNQSWTSFKETLKEVADKVTFKPVLWEGRPNGRWQLVLDDFPTEVETTEDLDFDKIDQATVYEILTHAGNERFTISPNKPGEGSLKTLGTEVKTIEL